jgi:hypothetical protein
MKKDESAARGQKIRTESAPDRSSEKRGIGESVFGRSMKGNGHDLQGTGAYNDKK